jgi:hypothetical protein
LDRKAVARQLAEALAAYKTGFDEWCRSPKKLDFGRVDRQMEGIRVLRMALPQVSTEMVRVLIAHTDLSVMHIRMRSGSFGQAASPEALLAAAQAHTEAVEKMRKRCLELSE